MTDQEKREAKDAFVKALNLAGAAALAVYEKNSLGKHADEDWRETSAEEHARHIERHAEWPFTEPEHIVCRAVMMLWKDRDDNARTKSEQTDDD